MKRILSGNFGVLIVVYILILFSAYSCTLGVNEENTPDQSYAQPNQVELESEESLPKSNEEITTQDGSSGNTEEDITQSNPLGNKNTDELIPVFIFNADNLYIVDYEMNTYYINHRAYSINKDFEVNYGNPLVRDLLSGEVVGQIQLSNCDHPGSNFLIENYMVILCEYDCPPDQDKIQAWDFSNNSYIGEIHVGWAEYCSNYVYFAHAPDNNRFLLSSPQGYTRLFSINPFQELSMDADDYIGGELVSSPDKTYVVANGESLWKWTNNGIEFVDKFQASNYLSVSSNVEFAVYRDYSKSPEVEMVVFDRVNNNEVLRISEDDLMYGGFDIDKSALSHDGEYLFLSGKNIDDYYIIVMKTRTGEFLRNFGPFGNLVPGGLRIEYLPESIRKNWVWEDY